MSIFYNVFDNCFKFAKSWVKVELLEKDGQLNILISNDVKDTSQLLRKKESGVGFLLIKKFISGTNISFDFNRQTHHEVQCIITVKDHNGKIKLP